MDTQIISLSNQKGGVGKTTTCANLGIGLAREGKRVLLVDCDPQASLTLSLGWRKPETLSVTLATLMGRVLQEQPVHAEEAILHHAEGVDLIPGSIALSGVEVSLDTRQNVLKRVLDDCRKNYSHVLLDCMPSLGMMTINALAAADSVLIPTIPHYLSVDGLGKLMESIGRMRRGLNRGLRVEGILITMASRTTYAREISELLRTQYGTKIKVFDTAIPHSIRAAECSAEGKSIFAYDPKGKVAQAYRATGQAPKEYLEYARWLAANALTYAQMTGEITVSNVSISVANGVCTGTATLTTDAPRIRIRRSVGTITGYTGGEDGTYVYLNSGDTITVSQAGSGFSFTAESVSTEELEANFLVAVPDVNVQKVVIPQRGSPYPLKSTEIRFDMPNGALVVTMNRCLQRAAMAIVRTEVQKMQ